MLDALITSKTRIKLLLKFFLNSKSNAYLRNLESEFGDSTNSIRIELIRFEKAGLLKSWHQGNKKIYGSNADHPLFSILNKLMMKHIGFDQIIIKVIEELGDVKSVFVVGDFANGIDNKIIDLIFVGKYIDRVYLAKLIEKSEKLILRKIKYLVLSIDEFSTYQKDNKGIEPLLLWKE